MRRRRNRRAAIAIAISLCVGELASAPRLAEAHPLHTTLVQLTYDEHAHVIKEKIEVKLENKGKQAVDVVAREFLWRWPMFKIESDESPRGTRAGAQTQEYRLSLPAGGKKSIAYTVVYSW